MSDEPTGTIVGRGAPPQDPPQDPPTGGGGGGPTPPEQPRHRRQRSFGDKVRFVLRGVGQTLITAGLVVLLFVVYQVYITNYFSHRAQAKVHKVLEHEWANGKAELPIGGLKALDGHGIANLYIPRFGTDYAWTIVQGTNFSDLEKGPGHYTKSQLPGQKGDFSVAGHRVGKGEPFLNLDKLKPADEVVVETRTTWYVYCVIGAATAADTCNPNARGGSLSRRDANGVPGREVVAPSSGEVVLAVPNKPAQRPPYTTAYMTMTTCTPKFTAENRMIVHAVLDPAYPKGIAKQKTGDSTYSNTVPAAVKALYTEIGN